MDENTNQAAEPALLNELAMAKATLDDLIADIRHSRRVDNRWLFAGVRHLQSGIDCLASATES
ncbi:MAG: hypothetical protein HY856_13365 [Burkholderiales bacterium]|nr:hypothetical protein [Burkholderiales bacterium]